ncbi:hypothetical protein BDV38DRAFT_279175 [Aspergillus pseudotamarii]|uniref:Uncharacterized protein n=1 Tax=Aspergillus pseudotamarii TaxID=132259 RepID=A0A5N6T4Q6_ASPPS|nr:uncharacterized protein BDV38DRAFT_279175 [Aspergillus pseudotamarii]KAE8141270.1 hypothetical protein BDV38DRAFT_279175 [Aspergillus pseudotamarii]
MLYSKITAVVVAILPLSVTARFYYPTATNVRLYSEPSFDGEVQDPYIRRCTDLDPPLRHNLGSAEVKRGHYCRLYRHQGCAGYEGFVDEGSWPDLLQYDTQSVFCDIKQYD